MRVFVTGGTGFTGSLPHKGGPGMSNNVLGRLVIHGEQSNH